MTALILSAFLTYTTSFVKDSHGLVNKDDINGPIIFKSLEYSTDRKGAVGYCYPQTRKKHFKIEVDPVWWGGSDENERWSLMYHELGHCVCDFDHIQPPSAFGDLIVTVLHSFGIKTNRSDYFPDGCVKNIMHPYVLESHCVENHREAYLKDLFAKCRPERFEEIHRESLDPHESF